METPIQRLERILRKLHNHNHGLLGHDPNDLAAFTDLLAATQRAIQSNASSLVWPAPPPAPEVAHTLPQ